jgi:hypothetical protein
MADSRKSNVSFGTALVVIALFCLGASIVLPTLVGGGPAKVPMIVNNLKQIDLAKEIWASDHKITNAVQVTNKDLAAYLRPVDGSNLVRPVDDERYVINPVGAPPEALLTRQLGKLPKGTIIRLGSNGVQKILPNLTVPQSETSHPATQTNGQPAETGSRR